MLIPNSTLQNGRYRIIRHLGGGGQGNVYEAHDTRLNNRVAIKEALGSDPATQQAFQKEAQRLDRLRHPALPTVKDHFIEGQRQYLVMEFIAGQDLAQMLNARGQPFPVEEVLAWGEQLLDALAYLHQRGVIHRDIKPANLKLTAEGEIVLLDFGLAKGGLTYSINSRSVKGYTPGFAPPEQMTGQATDQQSDLYSLGATLYALLTGATPIDPLNRLYAQSQGKPDPLRPANELNPQVPAHIAQILTGAMALEPTQRPATAKKMLALLSQPPPRPMPPRAKYDEFAPDVKKPVIWFYKALDFVAPMLLVVIILGFAIMFEGNSQKRALMARRQPKVVVVPRAPTPTIRSEASPTATFNPRATPAALASTPLPQSLAVISDENASKLREMARLSKGEVSEIAYSPDGQLLAVGTSSRISLYDAQRLKVVRLLDSQAWINTVAFSPDGMWLAANGPENRIQLWRVSDGQLLATLEGHTESVRGVSFSPDSELLASGSGEHEGDDYTVRLWRVSDGQLLATLAGHTTPVWSVSFSPDGEWLVSASGREVRRWRMSDGQPLSTLEGHTSSVRSVSFSPDSKRLASASGREVRLWRVSDGQLLATLEGHIGNVSSVSFSPDSELLASASWDHTVRLWRVSDGQLLATLEVEGYTSRSRVESVSYSPDGRLLASSSYDGTIRLWGVVE